ncbi:biotin/lipoate A/B protein ligase family protein [Chlamydia pneumoniae LPCoLN]|uniref:lipoate--protein ligase family protein n=1 Tax=Chlamydia pneumoniae TaxID=83558 RepID=UPI0001BD9DD2|nr:lipoate--protein ligase family protein [Chlamydia pneumoniae]ACZ32503.1 biotin/lipoate A/B protein ligase family protein [Chlamydia pneumoniae LPCoLN]ETR80521.1 Lipoate-protein ligase A type 2 [Chlamydia pneumoniae B21]
MPTTNCIFLDLRGHSILHQLQIEEALLRVANQNFCIINSGVKDSIVLGISRNLNQDVHISRAQADHIPIIRRYSGGGTVFIDSNTLMVSWIMNSSEASAQPQELLAWTYGIYSPLLPNTFSIRENDYVLGHKKIGGNAQYIQRHRWVHHTTFLWDIDLDKLSYYLPIPQQQPTYRNQRSHEEFLTTLRPWFPSRDDFLERIKASGSLLFTWEEFLDNELEEILAQPHRKATTVLN